MTIIKDLRRKEPFCVVHHRKKGLIGKPIPGGCHKTYKEALAQHKAIYASEARRKAKYNFDIKASKK